MKRGVLKIAIPVFFSLFLPLLGCSENKTEKYKIAVVVDLSQDNAEFGKSVLAGVKYAQAVKNNKNIEVVHFDDENNPEMARQIALKLVSERNILAVIGNASSGLTAASQEIYGRYKVPFLLPVATVPLITISAQKRGENNLLRVVPTHDLQAFKIADFSVKKWDVKRVLVVNDKTDYGLDLGPMLEKTFQNKGITVPLRQPIDKVDPAGTDYSNVVTNVGRYKIDLLVFAGYYTEASYLVKQIRQAGVTIPIVLTDGCFSQKIFTQFGDQSDNVYVAFFAPDWKSVPEANELIKNVSGQIDDNDLSFAPFAFDAASMLLNAIEINESHLSRENLISTLKSPNFQFKGIVGNYDFNSNGDWSRGKNYIYKIVAPLRTFVFVE